MPLLHMGYQLEPDRLEPMSRLRLVYLQAMLTI